MVREASDWATRLSEDRSAETEAAFRKWHDADARHAEAYAEVAEIWNLAGQVSPTSNAARLGGGRPEKPVVRSRLALAAGLAALALAASLILLRPDWMAQPAEQNPQAILLATAIGEIREAPLPDGSRMLLDSATRVEVRFGESERSLMLIEGRARFRVAPDRRPFVVRAGHSEVVATATLFDVSVIGRRIAVVLLEGLVEVRSAAGGHRRQRLEPGQKLTLRDGGPPVRQRAGSGEAAWPRQMLDFADSPLDEVADMANRYSRVKLELGGARVAKLRVTGAFRAGDVPALSRSLAATFGLRVETLPNGNLRLVDPDARARGGNFIGG